MAIFGKDNSDLLHQILRELGELRERVTGQQQAIEQLRGDTTAALNTGLAETRAVVRDGLQRHQEMIGDPLNRIGGELVAIRNGVNDLGRERQTSPQTAAEPGSETADQAPTTNNELLRAAAGISAAELQMHRDAWSFLVEHAAGDRHFRVPGSVKEVDGAVTVQVSGPSIVAALTSLQRVSDSDDEPGTRAIAEHLHQRFSETVQAVIEQPHRGDGVDPVRIVIDDRAKAASEEEGD
ncbi:hypothetical protein [Streptomyces hokutonensis]|uniref:YbaB/EbfC DNA-binding family protein n=1 Tax=Streptomyces hokutonensis TaxID=1306990 RepID=A0ABW6M7B6_9ACTN